ncbi:hypothetical protein BASA83_013667 [Batrachochytrium salamandrivorans]|nr:hypothetical protein BASA83_013667 [Batrachochytrium salamandrivorans]
MKFRETTSADSNILVSALSSLKKLYFLVLSDSGPFRTLTLSSWIAAPMIFYGLQACSRSANPSLELSTPITLRLADGDSSSCLTHRTVPLQLHIGKHVETATFTHHLESRELVQFLAVFPILSRLSHAIRCISICRSLSVSDVSVPPDILSSFSSLFSEDQAEVLPPHRDFDCSIDLKPGSEPFHGKIYQLTREEDKVMQEWIKDNLRKVKDRNPIPLISELLRTLSTGKIFTTLDLRGAYNLLRIKEGDESKTSFITKYGQFEFLVMPFGLANAPAQFQRMMNSLFRDVIGKHVLVYLDDIVIYSDNMSDHIAQVQNVLRVLQDNRLYCKAEKCHFYKSEIKYLGYIISADGLRMDPSKISAVQSWPTPNKVRDLQVLLGFTNFYRALIHDYSSMTANLTKLFKKDVPFVWGPEQEKSLQDLKTAFANSDFLTHPDDSRPFILETDASDYAISGVLSQYDDSNTLRPIAFYARQMNSAEQNYEITTKSCWLSSSRLNIGGISFKVVSILLPFCAITRIRVFHDDQEINSSSGSLVFGIIRVRLLAYSSTWKT